MLHGIKFIAILVKFGGIFTNLISPIFSSTFLDYFLTMYFLYAGAVPLAPLQRRRLHTPCLCLCGRRARPTALHSEPRFPPFHSTI